MPWSWEVIRATDFWSQRYQNLFLSSDPFAKKTPWRSLSSSKMGHFRFGNLFSDFFVVANQIICCYDLMIFCKISQLLFCPMNYNILFSLCYRHPHENFPWKQFWTIQGLKNWYNDNFWCSEFAQHGEIYSHLEIFREISFFTKIVAFTNFFSKKFESKC